MSQNNVSRDALEQLMRRWAQRAESWEASGDRFLGSILRNVCMADLEAVLNVDWEKTNALGQGHEQVGRRDSQERR